MDHEVGERLADGRPEAERVQPARGGGARRRGPLADLVAVEDQHARARSAQLAGDGQPGEAGPADQDVPLAAQPCALAPRLVLLVGIGLQPTRGGTRATLPLPFQETPIRSATPHAVEGSNGLLLEIDGEIVPNYDATIVLFEEGDVVTGNVVRIDKDEVLVDIGYKSEGVIPRTSCPSASPSTRRRRSRSGRRWTPSSSPRRTRTAA